MKPFKQCNGKKKQTRIVRCRTGRREHWRNHEAQQQTRSPRAPEAASRAATITNTSSHLSANRRREPPWEGPTRGKSMAYDSASNQAVRLQRGTLNSRHTPETRGWRIKEPPLSAAARIPRSVMMMQSRGPKALEHRQGEGDEVETDVPMTCIGSPLGGVAVRSHRAVLRGHDRR